MNCLGKKSRLLPNVLLVLGVSLTLANTGCLTCGYRLSDKNALPAVALNLPSSPAIAPPNSPSESASTALSSGAASLSSVIVYEGPGSWKKAAFWDEYVVTVTNR